MGHGRHPAPAVPAPFDVHGRVVVAHFLGAPTVEQVMGLRTALSSVAGPGAPPLGVAVRLQHLRAPPAAATREAVADLLRQRDLLAGWAVVLDAGPFVVSMARAVSSAILLAARTAVPVHMTRDPADAAQWLGTVLSATGPGVDEDAVTAALSRAG